MTNNKKSKMIRVLDIIYDTFFYLNIIGCLLTTCGSKPAQKPNLETKIVQEYRINDNVCINPLINNLNYRENYMEERK